MGTWEEHGKSGWKTGQTGDKTSIVDFGPMALSATNVNRDSEKYVKFYKENSTITSWILEAYRSDYVTFGLQVPSWICTTEIEKTEELKRALRSLPRMSRPPCKDLQRLWITP